MRVFISYGRKDAADFARRLAGWLRERGHDPWLDVENGIPIGAPFDVRIELGIQNSDAVLALLTPWSLRPEGFCRNEILYAQGSRRPVIPVRLADVTPPIQIISLNYIDAAADPDSAFGELPDALRRVATMGGVGYRDWSAANELGAWWTNLRPDRFEEELERHGGGFVGREWLFEEVRAWVADRGSRLLLVTADVGFGKSAAVAQMSARLNVRGVHFCTRSLPESCRPDRWLKGLVYQLAAQFPAYREKLTATEPPTWTDPPESLFRKLIADPLREIRATTPSVLLVDEPWVFVVDALDEAWAEAGDAMAVLLADSAARVPDFLRIVTTSRPDRDILAQFRLDGIQCRHLDAIGAPNRRDLQAYIERRLETPSVSVSVSFPAGTANRLAVLADGNFLFARLSLDALGEADSASRLSLEDIGAIRPESGGLYCAMFRKRFRDKPLYERDVLPLLDCLIAAQGPVPEKLLTEASGLAPRTASRGIAALSQFLTGGASGMRLFHQSLADWLRDPKGSAYFLASPERGHERLAEIGWQQYQDCASGPGPYSLAPYARTHLPAHLAATRQWDRLVTLLTDLRYVEQRVATGVTFDLIRDYNTAAAALPEAKAGLRDGELRDARVTEWICQIVKYAAEWNARRDSFAAGATVDERDPDLPASLSTCRMCTKEEIEAECDRIIRNPTPTDRLDAFMRFVSSQCYALLEFGGRDGFVRQHALNWEPAGPVRETATRLMGDMGIPWLERNWPPDALPTPRSAELRTLEGHSAEVLGVSVTPDGRRAVSGSDDKTLRVWDLESGAHLRTLEGHSAGVRSVSVTPDGHRAVSGSDDKTLRVWDLESGACLRTLEGHSAGVQTVSVTPDGRRVVSGSSDKTLRVWDLESGACLRTLEGHSAWVPSVSVTPDGRRAVSGSWDKTLRVWDLESGACLRTLEGHSAGVRSVSVTPDGRRAVSGSDDRTLRVWGLESDACLRTLEGHSAGVQTVSVTPDGRRAVSGSSDKTLRVWDLETGPCLGVHPASAPVSSVASYGGGMRICLGVGNAVYSLTIHGLETGIGLSRE